jgi:hypothetical protein
MASRVEYAVSATPICTIAAGTVLEVSLLLGVLRLDMLLVFPFILQVELRHTLLGRLLLLSGHSPVRNSSTSNIRDISIRVLQS